MNIGHLVRPVVFYYLENLSIIAVNFYKHHYDVIYKQVPHAILCHILSFYLRYKTFFINSQHTMDVIMATSIQRCNSKVKAIAFSRRRYPNVLPTLHQLCKERKMWTIHDHIVTFPQPCLTLERLRE